MDRGDVALTRSFPLLLIISAALLTGMLASAAFAQGTGFSMSPDPDVTSSLESGFFHYQTTAGAKITDAVRIANTTDGPVDLVLYPSDASTSDNGGIAFPTTVDGEPEQVGRWLSVSERQISIEPGEVRSVPFTLAVPADAVRGEHTAGIVAQPADTEDAPEGQFSVSVISRSALTVLVTVGDGLEPSLTIDGVRSDTTGAAQIIVIDMTNDGELGFRSTGSLGLESSDGASALDTDFAVGYFVPGDSIAFTVPIVPPVEPGDYSATVRVDYEGRTAEYTEAFAITTAEDNGIVVEAGDEIVIEEAGGLSRRALLLIIGGGLLLIGLVLIQTLRLQRLRQR